MKRNSVPTTAYLLLVIVLAFSLAISLLFYYGPSAINQADDFSYVAMAKAFATHGINGFGHWQGLDWIHMYTKYIMTAGIAFFYKLFGVSRLSSAMLDMLMLLGTVVVLFFIGKELYNYKAGLLAGLLYGMYPLAVIQATSIGDVVPMAFFASLAVLLIVLGWKSKKHQKPLYALSGFIVIIGFFASQEVVVTFAFLIPFLAALLLRTPNKKQLFNTSMFFFGVLMGLAVIAVLGYMQSGNFLFIFKADEQYFSAYCSTYRCSSLTALSTYESYPEQLMLFNPIQNFSFGFNNIAKDVNHVLFVPQSTDRLDSYQIGLYFFFTVISLLYLLIRRDRVGVVPAAWFMLVFISTSFINTVGPLLLRYTLIFGPAMALVIAFAITRLLESGKKSRKRHLVTAVKRGIACFALLLLVVQSVHSIMYVNYSQYNALYPLIGAGHFTNFLTANTTVYKLTYLPVDTFMNNLHNLLPIGVAQCPPQNDSYIVTYYNYIYQQSCSLNVAFKADSPRWLQTYDLFNNTPWDYYNLTVYYKR